MGKMVEDMEGVMMMVAVGIREQYKQRRHRHNRNKGPWEIHFGEERGYDGKWCDDEHDGIYALQRVWSELEMYPDTNKCGAPKRKNWCTVTITHTVTGVSGDQTGT